MLAVCMTSTQISFSDKQTTLFEEGGHDSIWVEKSAVVVFVESGRLMAPNGDGF